MLVFAKQLDKKGGYQTLTLNQISAAKGLIWLHLDSISNDAATFLTNICHLPPNIIANLLIERSRPFAKQTDTGIVAYLRGANLNDGARAEDMITLRLYATKNMLITVRRRRLQAIEDVSHDLHNGKGARSIPELFAHICDALTIRTMPVLEEVEQVLAAKEDHLLNPDYDNKIDELRLSKLRLKLTQLSRYLQPMQQTYDHLQSLDFFTLSAIKTLSKASRKMGWLVSDLTIYHQRAEILYQEYTRQQQVQENHFVYVLTIVATLFIPPSFLVGLFGMNFDTLPFSSSDYGFLSVCLLCLGMLAIQFGILKKIGLLNRKR